MTAEPRSAPHLFGSFRRASIGRGVFWGFLNTRQQRRGALQAQSSPDSHQMSPGHPQIAQRKQRRDLRGVLAQSAVADLGKSELPLDHPEGMFDLGTDAGLDLLDLVDHRRQRATQIQSLSLSGPHGHMPLGAPVNFRSLVDALIARIRKRIAFIPMQKGTGPGHVVHVARRAEHRVYQAGLSIDTNVRLHSEVPRVSLLRLVHVGVALAARILGRAGRGDHRGVHHRAGAHHQTLAAQYVVDHLQHPIGQLELFEQVPESQNGLLVWQPPVEVVQARELSVHRRVVQRFFHGRVAEAKPLLHKVNAQHGLDGEGTAPALFVRGMRRHQRHQFRPRDHAVHLVQELPLASALGHQVESQARLLHGSACRWKAQVMRMSRDVQFADLP